MVETIITAGTNPSNIHCIGLSLGAHVCAYVAKGIPGIGRITGLDPAGPLFTGQASEVRLVSGDANFTDVIHTNGNPLWGLGTSDEDGDVNFWVNGGWDQPNCGLLINPLFFLHLREVKGIEDVLDMLFCSHGRSMFYYTEALASNCTFWGVRPNKFNIWISRATLGAVTKSSNNCTIENCVPMGIDTINAAGRGNFIVATNYKQPYCVSQP
ncbi:pancreatic lipase-related protein 3-like [Zootermopsis nevadensis]|uniref:Pancreatic lipase-related protein 3 n=1 Tax=Zootermopsis nevadensis TaxID=136037 RepID=A0A067QIU4_ZOONE|nr:pancreatic lipase-related protein 3-like [Zootermopsis nevadensis]KDR07328.1 Pancreatic lipase-related protein 3 [Zootermopsis nevadensis]